MLPRNEAHEWLDEMGIIIPWSHPDTIHPPIEQQLDELGIILDNGREPRADTANDHDTTAP